MCRLLPLFLALVLDVSSAAAQFCATSKSATELGKLYTFTSGSHKLTAARLEDRLAHSATAAGRARYLRAMIEVSDPALQGWLVTIRDADDHVLQTLGPGDFADSNRRWTDRLPFSEVFLELSGQVPADFVVRITDYFVIPDVIDPTFYSVLGNGPSWKSLYGAPQARRRLGDSVAMLLVPVGGNMKSCTGFAVTSDLLLTNWHCGPHFNGTQEVTALFWSESMCRRVLIDFSWDDDSVSRDFECTDVVASNEALDYALLRITAVSSSQALKPVRLAAGRPPTNTPLMMIHHPLAEQKQLTSDCVFGSNLSRPSWRKNEHNVEFEPNAEFEHLCDSEGGSSGAPVFHQVEGTVVGLHHLGFDRDPDTCAVLEDRPKVNKAVWIDSIVRDLNGKGISVGQN